MEDRGLTLGAGGPPGRPREGAAARVSLQAQDRGSGGVEPEAWGSRGLQPPSELGLAVTAAWACLLVIDHLARAASPSLWVFEKSASGWRGPQQEALSPRR